MLLLLLHLFLSSAHFTSLGSTVVVAAVRGSAGVDSAAVTAALTSTAAAAVTV
jgi:hypothetical protein